MKTAVFLTGATGTMGLATLRELLRFPDRYSITVLARPSRKNRRVLRPYMDRIKVVWGDLTLAEDVLRGVEGSDIVLHMGGMVSPKADYYPELTWKVNTWAARNICDAILAQEHQPKLVYIGSVAQMGHHAEPYHWGRAGDPVRTSQFDKYGESKVMAERILTSGELDCWVSLRQSGILYPGILKNYDPIMFHVPLRGVLEWATVEDSARLMERVCRPDVPQEFWKRYYNISSGADYRLSNYEFECLLLEAVGCPPPEKIFETRWFATRNFHGMWYADADVLEQYFHFRENVPVKEYFRRLGGRVPKIARLSRLVPWAVKWAMAAMAYKRGLGTQDWIRRGDTERIRAFYGSLEEYESIPDWKDYDLSRPSEEMLLPELGYDASKPLSELDLADMRGVAQQRGGRCVSAAMVRGDLDTPLEWETAEGERFWATPRLIVLGGHFSHGDALGDA